ncbi:hypothetical protein AAFF_G00192800 [Aldrovandia affinis]|uniref:Uncharacterized protein n=1 Tax=Aldrovandia affinis TaxID=143900 RepID=A0AAD7W6Z2_9TELE|nr:hypothetical protein AAFF_G00192800 [Aldrovandia affinis]
MLMVGVEEEVCRPWVRAVPGVYVAVVVLMGGGGRGIDVAVEWGVQGMMGKGTGEVMAMGVEEKGGDEERSDIRDGGEEGEEGDNALGNGVGRGLGHLAGVTGVCSGEKDGGYGLPPLMHRGNAILIYCMSRFG